MSKPWMPAVATERGTAMETVERAAAMEMVESFMIRINKRKTEDKLLKCLG